MELKVLTKTNAEKGSVKLPDQFNEVVRLDLIKKAVLAIQANKRQVYGNKPGAGMRHSAKLSRRRRKYRGGYGAGISRVPRKILSRSGTRFNWVGATSPGTVGGRRAHGPTADKVFAVSLNDKERKKAIRSALAATLDKKVVEERGHKVPANYPFALDSDFESIAKTKDFVKSLEAFGLNDELNRSAKKTIRAGKGTMRNRRYKKRVGPLVVVSSKDSSLAKSGRNVPGLSVVEVSELNAELLAPGAHPGRLTLFTKDALAEMEERRLFI